MNGAALERTLARQLQDARRSIEEVNISGLALARLTIHRLPSPDGASLCERVEPL